MRILGNIGIRVAIIAIIAVVGIVFRDRLTGNAGDLRVGDCFDEPAQGETVKDVQHQPCNEGHTAEVILVTKHPAPSGAASPTLDDSFIVTSCTTALIEYVGGADKVADNIDVGVFYPVAEDWSKGTRDMTCYAYTTDGSKLTSSLKAAP